MSKIDSFLNKPKTTTEPERKDIDKLIDEKIKTIPVINKTTIKKESLKPETKITSDDRQEMVKSTLQRFKNKGIKLRRRERKMITNLEYDTGKNTQGTIIGLAVTGIVLIVLLQNFFQNDMLYAAMIMLGSLMFLPVGMIIGWVILDPVMRCKVMRKVTRQNYGVVNFVGKGNKIISKIKNFDYSLIWRTNDCWVLTRDRIYQNTKDGNAANDGNMIDPESVTTLVETVPVIFVDMDSMEPLSIHAKDRIAVYPSEIGPALKAWMDNQRAKMMGAKKATDMLMYIVIIVAIAAVGVSFMTYSKVEELEETLKALLGFVRF